MSETILEQVKALRDEMDGYTSYTVPINNFTAKLFDIEQQLEDAEPVAWGTLQEDFNDEDRNLFTDRKMAESYQEHSYDLTSLYTHPTPSPDVDGLVEALIRAERKLSAYVGVCKDDKELTGIVLPMAKSVLAKHGVKV